MSVQVFKMSSMTLPRWFSSRKARKKCDEEDEEENRGYRSLERNKKFFKVMKEDKRRVEEEEDEGAHTYENGSFFSTPEVESGCFRVADRSLIGHQGRDQVGVTTPDRPPLTHEDILRARQNLRKTLSVPCALQQQSHSGGSSGNSSLMRRQQHREFLHLQSRSKTRRSPRDALPSRPGEEAEEGSGTRMTTTTRTRLPATSNTFTSVEDLDEEEEEGAGEDEAFWPSPPPSMNINYVVEEDEDGANESMAERGGQQQEFRCWPSNGPSFTPPPLPEGITYCYTRRD